MKKLCEFSRSDRIITVISAVWLIGLFAFAFDAAYGRFNHKFVNIYFVVGIIPVVILVGIKWCVAVPGKDTASPCRDD